MKDFDWTSFTKRIAVKASLTDIYAAWTCSAEIEKWFLEKAAFYTPDGDLLSADVAVSKDCSYKWYWFLFLREHPIYLPQELLNSLNRARNRQYLHQDWSRLRSHQ